MVLRAGRGSGYVFDDFFFRLDRSFADSYCVTDHSLKWSPDELVELLPSLVEGSGAGMLLIQLETNIAACHGEVSNRAKYNVQSCLLNQDQGPLPIELPSILQSVLRLKERMPIPSRVDS